LTERGYFDGRDVEPEDHGWRPMAEDEQKGEYDASQGHNVVHRELSTIYTD